MQMCMICFLFPNVAICFASGLGILQIKAFLFALLLAVMNKAARTWTEFKNSYFHFFLLAVPFVSRVWGLILGLMHTRKTLYHQTAPTPLYISRNFSSLVKTVEMFNFKPISQILSILLSEGKDYSEDLTLNFDILRAWSASFYLLWCPYIKIEMCVNWSLSLIATYVCHPEYCGYICVCHHPEHCSYICVCLLSTAVTCMCASWVLQLHMCGSWVLQLHMCFVNWSTTVTYVCCSVWQKSSFKRKV